MVWISVAIALPMTFLSNWVVNLLYGSQYNQAGSVLMIHIWAGVFVALGVTKNKFMISENIQYLSFLYSFIGAILNIILNIFFIKVYGIKGAAISTLIAQISASYLFPYFHKKDRKSSYLFNKSILILFRKRSLYV